jgi:internalin A
MKTMQRNMTGAALVLALVQLTTVSVRADEAEDKAVKAIQKLGGKIGRDDKAKNKPIVGVVLFNAQVTDAALKELAGLKQLQMLHLSDTKVTDAGLKYLAGLKQLAELDLSGTKVTDAGLKYLTGLKQLQWLVLSDTKVTDAGLKDLIGLKQLQDLFLGGTKVTDAGLKELAGLKQLQALFLPRQLSFYHTHGPAWPGSIHPGPYFTAS